MLLSFFVGPANIEIRKKSFSGDYTWPLESQNQNGVLSLVSGAEFAREAGPARLQPPGLCSWALEVESQLLTVLSSLSLLPPTV